MSLEKVKEYFKQYDIDSRIIELSESTATVELAAQALGTQPCRIAKTLSFKVDDKPILIVAAGDVKIDNPKYKQPFGTKAKMLTYDEVSDLIGHNVGGVCPLSERGKQRQAADSGGLFSGCGHVLPADGGVF